MSSTDGNRTDRSIDRRSVLKSAGAAGVIGLSGCLGGGGGDGDGDGDGDTTPTPTATATPGGGGEEALLIGAVHPLTGPYGALAEFQEQGLKLAVQDINDSGLLDQPVESVHEDSQLDPQTGNQRARKLVEDDGVDMLTGAISSSVGAVIHEFAAEQNVPYLCPTAANFITMEDCKRTTFRYETRAQMTGVATAPWAVENFGTNVWIHNADYSWGNSVGDSWSEQALEAAADVEILGHTKSELGATDFSSYISEIAASDADWVATGMNGGDAVNFLKQSESYGLKGEVAIVSPTNAFQFIRQAAGSAAIDTYATIRYYENFDNDANRAFVDMFSDEYGRPPDNFAHTIWVTTQMWAEAVADAGTADTDPVIDGLEQVVYDGPMGTVSFRECDHQAERPIELGQIIEPDAYDWPDIEIQDTVAPEDAIASCADTGCDM
jgi:branched-chain amino acid transport system substrate-binding protein